MAKVEELKSLIRNKFSSEAECARALGWNRQRLNKITNGKKVPDVDELNELAIVLSYTVEGVAQFFLQRKSPNG